MGIRVAAARRKFGNADGQALGGCDGAVKQAEPCHAHSEHGVEPLARAQDLRCDGGGLGRGRSLKKRAL